MHSSTYSLLYATAVLSIVLRDVRGGNGNPCLVTAMMVSSPSPASIMRRAMELSNRANTDPSFGEEACSLWRSVLSSEESSLPAEAMSVAHGLHACTLARIGKDMAAIREYTTALELLKKCDAHSHQITKDETSIRVGMGRSLQRLFRYEDAANAFLEVAAKCVGNNTTNYGASWKQISCSNSVRSAALCHMRNGDLVSAVLTIEKYGGKDVELDGMYGALLLLELSSADSVPMQEAKRQRENFFQRARKLLLNAASDDTLSPVYKWIYISSMIEKRYRRIEPLPCATEDTFLALAGINNSPFDDPDLINLDDKIRLHSILSDSSSSDGFDFWPEGYILPDEYDWFGSDSRKNNEIDDVNLRWMLKERNGYGSHGNEIASTNKVLSMHDSGECLDSILCQRIIDPPLLFDGRKFSLRIYVVYFPRGVLPGHINKSFDAGVYIATEGLVKYAAAPYDCNSTNPEYFDDQYMTNSGRGDGRSALQYNLVHLQKEFQRIGSNYQEMWEIIEQSVQLVMARYLYLQRDESNQLSYGQAFIRNSCIPFCCIPKILGFDYILDSSAKPYLLEVNRFPGLEPRSSMDSIVKHTVVYDAWDMACDRTHLSNALFRNFRPSNYKGSSLKQLI